MPGDGIARRLGGGGKRNRSASWRGRPGYLSAANRAERDHSIGAVEIDLSAIVSACKQGGVFRRHAAAVMRAHDRRHHRHKR